MTPEEFQQLVLEKLDAHTDEIKKLRDNVETLKNKTEAGFAGVKIELYVIKAALAHHGAKFEDLEQQIAGLSGNQTKQTAH